jgi:hypothetical protein
MKAIVSPTKQFRPPSVSWVKRNSISSSSKQIDNENSPPSTNADEQSALFHLRSVTPVDIITNEHTENVRTVKSSSQSFISSPNISEIKTENCKLKNGKHRPKSTKVTRCIRIPPQSAAWMEQSSIRTLPKRIVDVNFPSSKVADELHHVGSEHTEPATTIRPENLCTVKQHSLSFSSMKNINEKDQSIKSEETRFLKESRPVSVTWTKRSSIHPLSNQFKHENQSITNNNNKNRTKSSIEQCQLGDLTPLDPIIDRTDQSRLQPENTNLVKYHFPSSKLMKNIFGKQEEKRVTNRR